MNAFSEENYPYMTPNDWELYHATIVRHDSIPTWFGQLSTEEATRRMERFCRFRNDLLAQGQDLDKVVHIVTFMTLDIAVRGEHIIVIGNLRIVPHPQL
jgi:hypothetical protein